MRKKDSYNYYDEFIKNAEYIVKSATILDSTVKNFNKDNLKNNINEVHGLENEADKALHNMRNYLVKDFLPPIDREDIILIGHRLDDVEDDIDEVLMNLNIYNVQIIKTEMIEFMNVLLTSTMKIKEALEAFKNHKKFEEVKQKTIEINALEEKGDKIFERAMKTLYEEEQNSLEVIKWTEIFKCIEHAIDSCEHIADSIEDVIMKNS